MTISLECQHCGKPLRIHDRNAGKTGRCPACGERIAIPDSKNAAERNRPQEASTPGSATTLSAPLSEDERVVVLREIADQHAAELKARQEKVWGCLLGTLFWPLGIFLLIRLQKEKSRSRKELSDQLDRLAIRSQVTREQLFNDAFRDPQLAGQERFLRFVSARGYQQRKSQDESDAKARELEFHRMMWEEYGLLNCEEFAGSFRVPLLCGTCGEPAGADMAEREIQFNTRTSGLHYYSKSVKIPQCASCYRGFTPQPAASRNPNVVAGKRKHIVYQKFIPECIGPLHMAFVRTFLALNHPNGAVRQMVKCPCSSVFWTGTDPVCPNCKKAPA